MPSKTLTDRFVAGVSTKTRTNYFDTKTPGLCLRVTPTGAKSWAFTYRVNGGPPQWITMGTYDAMTLLEARTTARGYRKTVDVDKRDPVADKKAAAAAEPVPVAPTLTVRTYAKTFIAFQKGKKKTWRNDEQKVDKYILPAWGDLPIAAITRKMVADRLTEIVASGITIGVNRIQTLISRFFIVALNQGVIDATPAARLIKRFKETARTRTLSEDEIRALWTALQYRPGEAADAIWLRLVLGQRGGETAGMLWRELDLDARTWLMDGTRTKNGRPHLVWLPDLALEVIRRRRSAIASKTEPRVFPTLQSKHCNTRAERELYHVSATFEDFDWRDLRRTFATGLGNLGFDDGVIGRILNHASSGITQKHYNHAKYLPEKQSAMLAWERELTRILKNKPKTSRVIAMRRR